MSRVVDNVADKAINEARQPLIDWLHAVLACINAVSSQRTLVTLEKLLSAVRRMQHAGEEIGALVGCPDLAAQATDGYAMLGSMIEYRDLAHVEEMLAMYTDLVRSGPVS